MAVLGWPCQGLDQVRCIQHEEYRILVEGKELGYSGKVTSINASISKANGLIISGVAQPEWDIWLCKQIREEGIISMETSTVLETMPMPIPIEAKPPPLFFLIIKRITSEPNPKPQVLKPQKYLKAIFKTSSEL